MLFSYCIRLWYYNKIIVFLILLTILINNRIISQTNINQPTNDWSAMYSLKTLAAGAGVVAAIGLTQWEYGSGSFSFNNEGWFAKNTSYRGMDKFGHMYTSILTSDLLAEYYYNHNNVSYNAANIGGSVTSLLIMTLMEIGDGTSKEYGFAYEDQIANTVGVLFSYLLRTYPQIDNKIDYRLDYRPSSKSFFNEFLTDYDHYRYLFALKLSGFNIFKDTYLKYLELHVGYYIRRTDHNLYSYNNYLTLGLGVNLSQLFNPKHKIIKKVFKYYQPPFTDIYYKNYLNK